MNNFGNFSKSLFLMMALLMTVPAVAATNENATRAPRVPMVAT